MKMRIPFFQMKTFGGKLAISTLSIFISSQSVAASFFSEWYGVVDRILIWSPERKADQSEFVMKSSSDGRITAQIDLRLKNELITQFRLKGLSDNFSKMSLYMTVGENRSYIFVRNLQVVWNFKVQNDPGLMDIRNTNMLVLDHPESHSNRDAVANKICRLLGGKKMLELSKGSGSSTPIDILHRYGFQDREANVSDLANNAVLIFSNQDISNPELEEISVANQKYPEENLFSLSGIDCKK